MTHLSIPAEAGTDLPTAIEINGLPQGCSQTQSAPVGEILRSAEAELDRAIAELARASERAMADGDPQGAWLYADRMYAAIRSRTPEHVARLEREALQRLDESDFAGDWTRAVLERRAA